MFLDAGERNSKTALTRALGHGFGLETDVRDLNGRLVISHDPPLEAAEPPELRWLLELIAVSGTRGRIALNVKADGLASDIANLVTTVGINSEQIFVFDMSIPDSIAYFKCAIPAYTRISDYEDKPAFASKAKGVWVDDFTGAFPQVQRAEELLSQGIRVALVSSELHRRDHHPLWDAIFTAGLHRHPLFELCTDHPGEAANLFC